MVKKEEKTCIQDGNMQPIPQAVTLNLLNRFSA
uniref:Uncharacterized protein n=1 Tax=Anguilla anguilla TaxID=7936 RepID=A0A0E9Q2Q6_ANGAN